MSDRILFQATGLPVLQNRTFATREEALASDRGDVCLVEDGETGLVYNSMFDKEKSLYNSSYNNEQSFSEIFMKHLDAAASIIERHAFGKSIVEIGCGKGVFLEMLRGRGYAATGFDPAYDGDGSYVVKDLFKGDYVLKTDIIILRHVLEHIWDPFGFLYGLLESNGGGGLIYIEVPCLEWICKHRVWFDIFYEHVNYFRLSDFYRIFGKVLESGHLFGGQYIYVVADLSSLRRPVRDEGDAVRFPEDFLSGRDCYRGLPAGPRAIWGGASKGVIFAIHMQFLGTSVDFAIDINPSKQGRYLPSSGLEVMAPNDAFARLPGGSDIFVMNENYLDEIMKASGNNYNYIVA
ncbi:MAG: methyltransferase domain-containing protein [Candidatus Competibacteraceae bacterium]|nr:methyltransferase domain-containing protein [Candidatus Competibacteraceae bacterium]